MKHEREQRSVVRPEVAPGQVTAAVAAALRGLPVRQVRRLGKRYRQGGAAALTPGNRGRPPAQAVPPALRQRIVALAQGAYRGGTHQHLRALRAARAGRAGSRAPVRRILLAAGAPRAPPAGPRPPRPRRPRAPPAGRLVPRDGSAPAWGEARGPRFPLLAGSDDAPGALPAALCPPGEEAHGASRLRQQLVPGTGRPVARSHDRPGSFPVHPKRAWRGQEHLAGHPAPPPFGRRRGARGSTASAAHSPQANGRRERRLPPRQDRPVVALRLAGAATLAAAPAGRPTALPACNARCAVPAGDSGVAARPLDPAPPPAPLCCGKSRRTVAAETTAPFAEQAFPLLPARQRRSWANAQGAVHARLDGGSALASHGACLTSRPAPPTAAALRARGGPRGGGAAAAPAAPPWPADDSRETPPPPAAAAPPAPPPPPAPDHPWRRPLRARRCQMH